MWTDRCPGGHSGEAGAQERGPGPLIAFVRRRGSLHSEVCLTDPEGHDVRLLTTGLGGCGLRGPAWSPDGRLVCHVALPDGCSRLAITPVDGSPSRLLMAPPDADDDSPAWSPDGARIAFSRNNHDGTDHLYLYSTASDTARRLTSGACLDAQPSWSPDGRWVVFFRALLPPVGLHVLSVETGSVHFLAPGQEPDWSPDGSLIAYSHGGLLWAIRVSEGAEVNGPPRQLTRDPRAEDRHPSWAPDGGHIVFSRRRPGCPGEVPWLVVLDVATGEENEIGAGEEPDWGPARQRPVRPCLPRGRDGALGLSEHGNDPVNTGDGAAAHHRGGRERWQRLYALRWW